VLILPGTVLASLSEKYAEAAGWTTIAKDPHHAPEEAVKRAVEARKLSATEPFDPGAFLRRLNMPSSIWAYILASMIVVALPFFWIHDKSRYFLLTDDYVEVMDYWTLAKQRYTYDRVERVDLGCSDDDAAYEIVLPGLSVDVLDRSSLRARFRDVEHVDGKIGSGAPRNLPPISYRDYPRCIERIVRDFDEDDAAAAAEIFRLEAWQRQRWIERTGKSERH
jgi:hypothetical protein